MLSLRTRTHTHTQDIFMMLVMRFRATHDTFSGCCHLAPLVSLQSLECSHVQDGHMPSPDECFWSESLKSLPPIRFLGVPRVACAHEPSTLTLRSHGAGRENSGKAKGGHQCKTAEVSPGAERGERRGVGLVGMQRL